MIKKVWVPERQDIVWIDFDPQVGQEMKKRHPMLVLSPQSFNARTQIIIGLPMTTAQSNESNPFAVKFTGPEEKISYILCHQPKSFDWKLRCAEPHAWRKVPDYVFTTVCEILNQIIDIH